MQLVSYEMRMAFLVKERTESTLSTIENIYPTAQEMEYFFAHTELVYKSLGFIQNQGVMQKLRRLYNRSSLEKNELNILRGMLSAVEKRLDLQKE